MRILFFFFFFSFYISSFFFFSFFLRISCVTSFLDKTAFKQMLDDANFRGSLFNREAAVSQPLTPLYPSCPQSSVSLPMYITVSCNSHRHRSRCSNDLIERGEGRKRKEERKEMEPRILSSIPQCPIVDRSAKKEKKTRQDNNFYYFPRLCFVASDTESLRSTISRTLPGAIGRRRRLRVQQLRGKDGSLLDGGWTTKDTLLYPGIAG